MIAAGIPTHSLLSYASMAFCFMLFALRFPFIAYFFSFFTKKISISEKCSYIRIVILTGRIKISGYEYEL